MSLNCRRSTCQVTVEVTPRNITFCLPPPSWRPFYAIFTRVTCFTGLASLQARLDCRTTPGIVFCLSTSSALHCWVTEPSRKVAQGSITRRGRAGGGELCLNICEGAPSVLPVGCIVQCALLFNVRGQVQKRIHPRWQEASTPPEMTPLQQCTMCLARRGGWVGGWMSSLAIM